MPGEEEGHILLPKVFCLSSPFWWFLPSTLKLKVAVHLVLVIWRKQVVICSPSDVQELLIILQQVQDEATSESSGLSWMVLGCLLVGWPQNHFLSFLLSLMLALVNNSEAFGNKSVYNLNFSPPAESGRTSHSLFAVPSAQGDLQLTSQLITLSIWSILSWRDSSPWGQVLWPENWWALTSLQEVCWRLLLSCSLPWDKGGKKKGEILQKTLHQLSSLLNILTLLVSSSHSALQEE